MRVIGVTGGIGSGKSHVARQFCELGAGLVDADRLGHQVLEFPRIRAEIRDQFGEGVFKIDGSVDRRKLGALVFGSGPEPQARLQWLESAVHPEIGNLIQAELDQFRRDGTRVLLLDAAVMFKTGWDRICDRIVFVECELPLRLERVQGRGWTEVELLARESQQLALAEKRRRSSDRIDNNRPEDPAWLQGQVQRLWNQFSGANP